MRALLDYDPLSGVSCYWTSDGKQVTLTHEQDISFLLAKNAEARNDEDKTKRGWKKDWWKYATIPTVVEMKWLQDYGVSLDNPDHRKKVFELLNSPEYKYLKTTDKIHVVSS